MKYRNVDSSAIAQVGYDSKAATLAVRFHDGREYHYFDVPRSVHKALLTAPSTGRYYQSEIRDGGYDCARRR